MTSIRQFTPLDYCDFQVTVGEHTYHLDRATWARISPWFDALFKSGRKDLTIPLVNMWRRVSRGENFSVLVDTVYTKRAPGGWMYKMSAMQELLQLRDIDWGYTAIMDTNDGVANTWIIPSIVLGLNRWNLLVKIQDTCKAHYTRDEWRELYQSVWPDMLKEIYFKCRRVNLWQRDIMEDYFPGIKEIDSIPTLVRIYRNAVLWDTPDIVLEHKPFLYAGHNAPLIEWNDNDTAEIEE